MIMLVFYRGLDTVVFLHLKDYENDTNTPTETHLSVGGLVLHS